MVQKQTFYCDNDGTVFLSSVAVAALDKTRAMQKQLALPFLQQVYKDPCCVFLE